MPATGTVTPGLLAPAGVSGVHPVPREGEPLNLTAYRDRIQPGAEHTAWMRRGNITFLLSLDFDAPLGAGCGGNPGSAADSGRYRRGVE